MTATRCFVGLVLIGLCITARAADAPGPVVIELSPKAVAGARTVTIGDIARLHGGNEVMRAMIAQLDVADWSPQSAPVTIKRTLVEFRLRVADIPVAMFQVTGAAEVSVTAPTATISTDRLYETARDSFLRRVSWSADDAAIRLAQPIAAVMPPVGARDDVRIVAEPHSQAITTGRVQMDVAIFVGSERKLGLPVYLDVRAMQRVAVCKERMDRGTVLTENNVVFEKRPVEAGPNLPAPTNAVLGKSTIRVLLPGQIVGSADLDMKKVESIVAVRARQTVTAFARIGTMKANVQCQALEDGRMDQIIRVKNTSSDKVLTGRVVAPGTVEIELGGGS